MALSESNLMRLIMLRLSKSGVRIFRNNVAMAWVGKSQRISAPTTVKLNIGDVVIRNARPLHAGLCNGSSDLIGWTPTTITEAMVGRRVAVFTAIEVKAETQAHADQVKFIEAVQDGGGIAGIARSLDEAVGIIVEFQNHKN